MTATLYDLSCQCDGHMNGPHAPSCNPIAVGVHSRAPRSTPSSRPIGRASRPASERSQDRAHHCAQSKRAPRLRPLHGRGVTPRSQQGATAGSLTRRRKSKAVWFRSAADAARGFPAARRRSHRSDPAQEVGGEHLLLLNPDSSGFLRSRPVRRTWPEPALLGIGTGIPWCILG